MKKNGWHIINRFKGNPGWEELNELIREDSGVEEDYCATEEEYRQAIREGWIRFDGKETTVWADGEYDTTQNDDAETMKDSEIIKKYRKAIEAEMVEKYRAVLESAGQMVYKVYVWEDGEIETLEDVSTNTYLQPKRGEARRLIYVATISSPFFYAFDYTDESEPEDEGEREEKRGEIIDYMVDEYEREGVVDAVDAAIDEAEEEESRR